MVQLIDKDALVAEIEKRIKINKECMLGLRNLDYYQGKVDALNDTLSLIDSMQEEPTIPDIVDEHFDEMLGEESIPLNVQEAAHQYIFNTPSLILPLLHDTDLRWEKVVIEELERAFTAGIKWKESQISKDASKLT